ncbi:MAG: OmpA family protein [Deltaproteobacteria bacterium]|nr:OmpA family protein [Deltaproteobacteria bacterium]
MSVPSNNSAHRPDRVVPAMLRGFGLLLLLFGGSTTACARAPQRHVRAMQARPPVFSQIHFPFDSDRLSPREMRKVSQNAQWLACYPEVVLWIEGHADRTGPETYNRALGDRRARAVAAVLMTHGVNADRLAGLISFGESRPAPTGRHRRVEMQVR